jgi:hypothetical protein
MLVEALLPLGNAGYLKAFTPEQLNAMVSLSLKSHDIGYGIGLLLFGPFFLVAKYLIFKSTYFPRAIGILYQIGGVADMVNGFVLILAPALRKSDVRRHRTSGFRWGGVILPLASHQGRERCEMAGTGGREARSQSLMIPGGYNKGGHAIQLAVLTRSTVLANT